MHWIDPDALPETRGVINTLVYNPRGELDGFVLDGERLVHVPPHLAMRLGRRAAVGKAVLLRAIKPRDAPVLAAVSLEIDGQWFVDEGPGGHRAAAPLAMRPADIVGNVRLTLFAPRGEVCGALLDDGTILRLHPEGNEELAEYFEPGRRIEAWGPAFRKGGTRVVDIEHVAFIAQSDDEAQAYADEHEQAQEPDPDEDQD